MERLKIIVHNGSQIAYLNANALVDIDEFCLLIEQLTKLAIQQKTNLILINITDSFMAPMVREKTKEEVKKAKQHFGQVHAAIVGLSGVQRLIANLLNKEEYFAKDFDDAKNWLVQKVNN